MKSSGIREISPRNIGRISSFTRDHLRLSLIEFRLAFYLT
jgi:hypothetical protein